MSTLEEDQIRDIFGGMNIEQKEIAIQQFPTEMLTAEINRRFAIMATVISGVDKALNGR